ncbi:hypothetical protein B0J13DRAFT_655053 [Dactylonectria estremocensis]|uniref:Uncharacterized protein n=1 Tax=Dactylonectria estremocensis TaxID=1079267 RepID=A0A9P9F5Y4_9HYPO|nr:hypothetical protein B0J13DRAFT_655053 [Dactylonectria estremocensis]
MHGDSPWGPCVHNRMTVVRLASLVPCMHAALPHHHHHYHQAAQPSDVSCHRSRLPDDAPLHADHLAPTRMEPPLGQPQRPFFSLFVPLAPCSLAACIRLGSAAHLALDTDIWRTPFKPSKHSPSVAKAQTGTRPAKFDMHISGTRSGRIFSHGQVVTKHGNVRVRRFCVSASRHLNPKHLSHSVRLSCSTRPEGAKLARDISHRDSHRHKCQHVVMDTHDAATPNLSTYYKGFKLILCSRHQLPNLPFSNPLAKRR